MQPPKWAQDLTLKALLFWESQGYKAPSFNLMWGRTSGQLSNGTSWSKHGNKYPNENPRVFLRQGKNHLDAKLCLLHEIAHQLADAGHTNTFWDIAWSLYRWAKLPIAYCKKREFCYKAGAQAAYKRNKKTGRGN